LVKEDLSEGRALHGLSLDDVVIKQGCDKLNSFTFKNERAAILFAEELHRLPVVIHFVKSALVRVLFGGGVRDFFQLIFVLFDLKLHQSSQLLILVNSLFNEDSNVFKVALLEARVADTSYHGEVLTELKHVLNYLFGKSFRLGHLGDCLSELHNKLLSCLPDSLMVLLNLIRV
jgi:hypothetical protein